MNGDKETKRELWDRAYRQAEAGHPNLLFSLEDEEIAKEISIIVAIIIIMILSFILYKFITYS